MFAGLADQPEDKIIRLMAAFAADPRPDRIDLGVGVYKNAAGITPVMRAVKAAEKRIWQDQQTKTYTGLAGDPTFAEALTPLVMGDAVAAERLSAIATPGGTGALRQGFELIRLARPDVRVFLPEPSWPNHEAILGIMGIEIERYRYFDPATGGLDFDGMMADLAQAGPDDVVLLHGCCHNPSGADPDASQWAAIAALLARTGAVPMIDLAYLGFGDGLEADAAATRAIAAAVPECLVAVSCSKNFGLYRERAGLLLAVSDNAAQARRTFANLEMLNRLAYSFPPDHGARVVTEILNDAALRADWQDELDGMRLSMQDNRRALADELRRLTGSDRFHFLAEHRGMFSRLGCSPEEVETLRRDHGVYMVGDSRMNIAGLTAETVPILARAIVDTGI